MLHAPCPRLRRAVTLVELLITMLIISILAGLILGVASIAAENGREAKTRQMVVRLHNLLMEHYGTYKTRRVRVRQQVIDEIDGLNVNAAQKGRHKAEARLMALRELLVMEVPDRWSDVALAPIGDNPEYPYFNQERTALANTFLRKYLPMLNGANALSGQKRLEALAAIQANEGAECLYMVITLATGDGEARSFFHESSIADTDGDSALEFLDGWGRPIGFLRWAPGFDSQIQINANQFLPLPVNSAWKAAAAGDHDPFDVFRVDEAAFRLVPLIFSEGGDESFGLRLEPQHMAAQGITNPLAAADPPDKWPAIYPYGLVQPDDVFLGADTGEGTSTDNIHNHLLSDRLKR
ncbi:MAG: type II secretion system GspH family protein [Planctomycetes bacterium]|nr:type II secretion system GspH family protein [Planctomycetota bacterium]